ncbi:autotransporter outer membrane beta-barrel domain-containing protein [Lelliottia sp. V89_10]|uniref:autotransporter outer membrane beta-barrel domain-containing protein n=1 Tax=Lelliottia wanjuensis TaxID=3050585 RepID=UPI00249F2F45|nr:MULTISPECIES: autotransporter outer membrane beta-barrel domain-containing protein [unclassified Lelliottia]MDI3360005.1 autotransporter outer membrane beta-barrel domain-containing protein [Lelliottia sp. V89_13]MDK9548231.1 autotransporter outer membrane beta-barrel domain-containing protein [Lelliottia sp. V89_5]MDK9594929.1 autotransporter outer membrane beta-barrel domain-containing protein [Lelliottia sp. V89_10]
MQTWKKKLVVSQIALACTLAIASQANAKDISGTTYNTYGYDNTVTTPWYNGYADWDYSGSAHNGDIYPVINKSIVNGVISTYNLDDGINGRANALSISNSTINGMITSHCVSNDCTDGQNSDGTNHKQYDRFSLTVDNSTINDTYEHYAYNVVNGDKTEAHYIDTYGLGNAITLDTESDIVIQNNSHVAGITLTQGYQQVDNTPYDNVEGVANNSHVFTNTLVVKDSVLTSGAYSDLGTNGFYGQSAKPSDYNETVVRNDGDEDEFNAQQKLKSEDDAALIVASSNSDNAMQTTATFDHSTITGDILFASTFDNNFYENGDPATDTTDDGVYNPTTNGWDGTDKLDVTLTNGSKWVGAAQSSVEAIGTAQMYGLGYTGVDLTTLSPNSIWPGSTYDTNDHVAGEEVYQSGLFNITLDNGSEWDTRKVSNIDKLAVNNQSQVNVENSGLLADSITLTNGSSLNIGDSGGVATDSLYLDSYSRAALTEETAELYANTITVDNGAELALGLGQVDTHNMVLTDGGVLNVASRDYVLNSDLNNARYTTNDKSKAEYDYGVVALNSDGHLAVNGEVAGNYKVRIDNATGAGKVADYKGNEVIRVYDNDAGTQATFTAANKADLGAYTYQAQQQGDTVVLHQEELTDYANMALSIPSANTNIWNLEQDAVGNRLTNSRHGLADKGGAWVSYFGGNFDGDNGVINYDQDVNGVMVGLDTQIDGNNAKWILGGAAGFAKGDLSDHSGQVDQDSQTAMIYSSAYFANNVFVDGSLNYTRFNNDLSATMSNGQYVDGNTTSDAWGFGLKLGYDWKPNTSGYVTPYAAVSGLFQSGDSYQLSNDMRMDGQSYDSMRYETGIDAGYTFNYGGDQALTPHFTLAYVYDDSSNDANVNGDSIDNGVKGSAVRVGLGTQFSFTKNFSTYTEANYLGGGDVDQNWGANLGVKYTW